MTKTIERSITELDIPEGLIRVSAAHLVTQISSSTNPTAYSIAILSPAAHLRGKERFVALGGAIVMREKGIDFLNREFNGHAFDKPSEMGMDARFKVPSESAREVLKWFAQCKDDNYFEQGPQREVIGELTGSKIQGYLPILPSLTQSERDAIKYEYLGVAIQPPPLNEKGTSFNEIEIPTRRIFHGWRMIVPSSLLYPIMFSTQIRWLEKRDLDSTMGGSRGGQMSDGTLLGDNLGLEYQTEQNCS